LAKKLKMKKDHMKTRLAVVLTALACLLAASVASRAAVDVSFSAGIEISSQNDFYEPLTPYGEWVSVGSYGRCWHPIDVEVGWRPYCEGHWEWTDCGWYWVSDEPWSWATYHYGSWIDDPNYGWCWIPGTEWAPSWVTWREAPDYIGWAPCGPGGAVLAPSLFVFVDVHHFSQPIRPHTVIVNNTTIINRTRVINDIRRVDRNFEGSRRRVVINEGPKVDVVARATGRTFTAKPVTEIVRQTPVPEHIKRTGTIERPVLKEDRQKIEQRKREHNTGAAQERQRTPSPTGREQPDNRQQPEHQRPEQVRPEQPPTHNAPNRQEETRPQERDRVAPQQPNSPTGREQPRVAPSEQHPLVPQRPEQHPTPNTPEHRNQPQQPNHVTPERAVPPSGQVRPEQHPTSNAPEHRDQVQPQQPNRVTPERPTPPTGREQPCFATRRASFSSSTTRTGSPGTARNAANSSTIAPSNRPGTTTRFHAV